MKRSNATVYRSPGCSSVLKSISPEKTRASSMASSGFSPAASIDSNSDGVSASIAPLAVACCSVLGIGSTSARSAPRVLASRPIRRKESASISYSKYRSTPSSVRTSA